MYQIFTNHWNIVNNKGDDINEWKECHADTEGEFARAFFYMRHAYPEHITILVRDGYIVSTREQAYLAKYIYPSFK